MAAIVIPPHLLPDDGRFGSGPAKVRRAQAGALTAAGAALLGTSHRQAPVRSLVGRVREGLLELLGGSGTHEIVLGNGGATAFWDIASFCLVEQRARHAVHGEFSAKFARATDRAPFLAPSLVDEAPPGGQARCSPTEGVDAYAYAHNETSTGVATPVGRVGAAPQALTLVDATSIAGAAPVDLAQVDAYYFAPQKVFGSDGGLWLAALSPAALERAERLAAERWVPEFLDLALAAQSSRKDQTLNTPSIATLVMLAEQLDWFLDHGGLPWAAGRSAASSGHVYRWAQSRDFAAPFVADPEHRSPVVATIDLTEEVDAATVTLVLREHGILDVEPYRKLGRNQVRIGTFPAVELADIEALTACLDHVVEALS